MSNKNKWDLKKFDSLPKLTDSKQTDHKMTLLAQKMLNPKPKDENLLYNLVMFSQIYFPFEHIDPNIPKYLKQGNLTMTMESVSIFDSEGKLLKLGIPYGAKVRLLMHLICSIAVLTGKKTFQIAANYQDLARKLGFDNKSTSIVYPIIEQFVRLVNITMRTKYTGNQGVFVDSKFLIEKVYMPKNKYLEKYDKTAYQKEIDDNLDGVKGIWIQLNQDYFDILMECPLPVDRRAVMLLKNNAQALDILNWLSYRLYKIKDSNGVFISWKSLYHQFGSQYATIKQFKYKFIEGMSRVMLFGFSHEMDNVKYNENGIILYPIDKDNWPTRGKNQHTKQLKLNF